MSDKISKISRRDFLKLASSMLLTPLVPSINKLESLFNDQNEQRLKFDEFKYLASNNFEATQIARKINFVDGEVESPSNMCGPLAASIMNDSNFYPRNLDLNPKRFWLGHPETLKNLLPSNYFTHTHTRENIRDFDFLNFPLKTGDFLFLHGGSFGHMIVVSSVDNQGRAYAISNILQEHGNFTIEKVMLYDPSDDLTGFFKNEWVRPGSIHGRTGVEFEIWRLKSTFINKNYFTASVGVEDNTRNIRGMR